MRRSLLICALGALIVTLRGRPAAAQLNVFAPRTAAPKVRLGDRQPEWSVSKHPPSSPADSSPADGDRHDAPSGPHHGHDRRTAGLFWGWGYPMLWSAGFSPAFGPYQPIYPYSIERGFGVWTPPVPTTRPRAVDPPAPNGEPKSADKPKVRTTNAASKARAGKFIGYGDWNFQKQSYLSAVERYKTAARVAPDVAEAYFRQGFAYVAMGRYGSAAKAFRRGLAVRSDWSNSPFRLDRIYGDNRLAKTAHTEGLAKAVEANPFDADLLMLLGLQIFFDGQAERSEVFFARVAQLGGNDDKLLDRFLPHPRPAGAGKPDKPARPNDKIVF